MTLFEYLQHSPTAFLISIGVLGLLVGSFLNVVIYRLPIMMEREWQSQAEEFLAELAQNNSDTIAATTDTSTDSAITPPSSSDENNPPFNLLVPTSTCPSCGHKIKPWENVPVISYLLLRGKCSQCKSTISVRYPLVEAVTAILSVSVAYHFGFSWEALGGIVLTWCLITLTMIDFDHKLLPDDITLPLLWLGLLINTQGIFVSLPEAVIGAIAGYLSLWSVYWLFKLATGKEGMGYGDFKLLAAFGAWLGWKSLPLIIIVSSFVGAVVGITLIVALGRDRNIPIPFGPYLAAAGWITLLWGDLLSASYFDMMR